MTIVVPVYNRDHLIVRCLDSLYAQTWRPISVILVDNASTDSTVALAEEWKCTHCSDDFTLSLIGESRRGAAYARQKGLEHTLTEHVMFFDSDDSMRPDCVAKAMEGWRRNPEADMVAWPVSIINGRRSITTHSISGNLLERHLVHSILRTIGYAVKTSFLRKCGGWNGQYRVWDDYETGTRLLLQSPEVIPVAEPMADVYPQEESITGTDFSSKAGEWENVLEAIRLYIKGSRSLSKRRLLAVVSYRKAILAAHYAKEGQPELADALHRQALSEVSKMKRPLIRFAYHWTRLGMRGAFSIVGKFL